MEDYSIETNKHGREFNMARIHTRYTLPQIIQRVCDDRMSVATASNERPSYIWWKLVVDEYGEIVPKIDLGKLPDCVKRRKTSRYDEGRVRQSWPKWENEQSGAWTVVLNEELRSTSWGEDRPVNEPLDVMLRHGISYGQEILSRVVGDSYKSGGYDDNDWDSTWDAEVIYADPAPAIDIPHSFRNFAAPSQFVGWRIA